MGARERRTQGGREGPAMKREATSGKTVPPTALSQRGTGGKTCVPGITCCRVDWRSACPADSWSHKPVTKASPPAALGVSIFWVWAGERVSHKGNPKGPEVMRVWGTSFPIWSAMDLKEWRNMLQSFNSLSSLPLFHPKGNREKYTAQRCK